MKKKNPKRKLDVNITGGPNDHLQGELEQWESAVIKNAAYFTFCKLRGPSRERRQTVVYRTFIETLMLARDDPQALIYAITHEGRFFCVPRKEYREAALIWHHQHPVDLEPHVFAAWDDEVTAATKSHYEWFSYAHGHTTGPWPDETQAALVGTVMRDLSRWPTLSWQDRSALCAVIPRLNAKLVAQGRTPIKLAGEKA